MILKCPLFVPKQLQPATLCLPKQMWPIFAKVHLGQFITEDKKGEHSWTEVRIPKGFERKLFVRWASAPLLQTIQECYWEGSITTQLSWESLKAVRGMQVVTKKTIFVKIILKYLLPPQRHPAMQTEHHHLHPFWNVKSWSRATTRAYRYHLP